MTDLVGRFGNIPVDLDLERLSDGINSEFWQWFTQYATREWGASGLRYQQAVKAAAQDANAVIELQKVLHTQDAILALITYPAEIVNRKRAMRQSDETVYTSRRGPGL